MQHDPDSDPLSSLLAVLRATTPGHPVRARSRWEWWFQQYGFHYSEPLGTSRLERFLRTALGCSLLINGIELLILVIDYFAPLTGL
ncbi:hypothetical protein AX14_014427 [Amanita brunnescens Koide BX004]|nr:hypothetical protein AX14_014427 [Amanita brunnescens Koide BX004]